MKGVNKKTMLVVGGLLFGLLVTYVIAAYAIPNVLVTFSKAAPASVVSMVDSYLIGQKILAKSDGKDKCVVNVFAVDSLGKGVEGKRVELSGADQIIPLGGQTDSSGKLGFEIVSTKEGQYTLEAQIDGSLLPKSVKVTFRNEL